MGVRLTAFLARPGRIAYWHGRRVRSRHPFRFGRYCGRRALSIHIHGLHISGKGACVWLVDFSRGIDEAIRRWINESGRRIDEAGLTRIARVEILGVDMLRFSRQNKLGRLLNE